MALNFHETSYRLHTEHTRKLTDERERSFKLPSIIASPESIDAFRHRRMYGFLRPLVDSYPQGSWMTVGDTGADAYALRQLGVGEVTATSLSCEEILLLQEKGHLDSVAVKDINAESVELPDDSFDFVLCKATFHHLPRAPIAFYELLRVSRQAVVYIEPAEPKGVRLFDWLRVYAKLLLRKQAVSDQLFESAGNFIFRVSETEFRKQCTAMQLDAMAFQYFNDFFHANLSNKKTNQKSAMLVFKFGIGMQDLFCTVRLMNHARIAIIVFKKMIEKELYQALGEEGYTVEKLPSNPFI